MRRQKLKWGFLIALLLLALLLLAAGGMIVRFATAVATGRSAPPHVRKAQEPA